jgi:hypothetical protein
MLIVTYAECHIRAPYAECRYAEGRGALITTWLGNLACDKT